MTDQGAWILYPCFTYGLGPVSFPQLPGSFLSVTYCQAQGLLSFAMSQGHFGAIAAEVFDIFLEKLKDTKCENIPVPSLLQESTGRHVVKIGPCSEKSIMIKVIIDAPVALYWNGKITTDTGSTIKIDIKTTIAIENLSPSASMSSMCKIEMNLRS